MKLGLFDITNYILIILAVFAFLMVAEGYGGLEKFTNFSSSSKSLLDDYYEKGPKKSNVRYSDQYLLIPTSQLSSYEQKTNNVKWNKRETPCGGTDAYPHICHSMYGKRRISK